MKSLIAFSEWFVKRHPNPPLELTPEEADLFGFTEDDNFWVDVTEGHEETPPAEVEL